MDIGLGTVALIALNGILFYIASKQRRRKNGEPPLVHHKLPFIGGALEFGRNPLGYLTGLKRKHGDVFTANISGWTVHFLTNPYDVKCLEKSNILTHDVVLHDFATRVVGQPHAFDPSGQNNPRGPALLSAIAKGLKEPSNLSKLADSCASIASLSVEKNLEKDPSFSKGSTIGLYEFLRKVIFDTTFHMFFGFHESSDQFQFERGEFYHQFMYYFEQSALLVDRISINLLPSVKRSRNYLLEIMKNLDLERRTGVSEMIRLVEEVGKEHVDELAHHFLIILWAAQANALPAIFWTIFHLLRYPHVQKEILLEYEEIIEQKRGKNASKTSSESIKNEILDLGKSDLARMVVFDACIKESLRLVGSSMVVRKAKCGGLLKVASGEYKIREGDYAMYYSEVTHMNPGIFASAEQYDFRRHLVNADERSKYQRKASQDSAIGLSSSEDDKSFANLIPRKRYGSVDQTLPASSAILTFGCGTSRCPGRQIAIIEIKLIILILLKRFNIKFGKMDQETPAYDMKHLGFGVMPPLSDVTVTISSKLA